MAFRDSREGPHFPGPYKLNFNVALWEFGVMISSQEKDCEIKAEWKCAPRLRCVFSLSLCKYESLEEAYECEGVLLVRLSTN